MPAVELVALAVWAFVVSLVGGLAGLVLGNLRLPLVVQLASSPAAGAGANVAISGASAVAAAAGHIRGGRVIWRLFAWMAPASLVGAILGGLVSGLLPDRILLGAIAVLVLYGAFEVARYQRPRPQEGESAEEAVPVSSHLAEAALIGFGVGVLGGFIGLILGSLRLPAMVRWVEVGPYAAVGTNAAVGVVVGIGGLLGHLPSGIDWDLLAVGAAGGVPGAYLGARLTGRLNEAQLLRAVTAVLVLTGLAMAAEAIVG